MVALDRLTSVHSLWNSQFLNPLFLTVLSRLRSSLQLVHVFLPRFSLPVHFPSICFDRALSKQLLTMTVIWTTVSHDCGETHGVYTVRITPDSISKYSKMRFWFLRATVMKIKLKQRLEIFNYMYRIYKRLAFLFISETHEYIRTKSFKEMTAIKFRNSSFRHVFPW